MKKIFSRNKKGFEMSFAVMFSIIAGAIILFLAIYATTQLINTSQYALYSESAQSLSNLLNPISNDISAATKAPEVSFKKETRIYLGCDSYHYSSPIFGRQVLSFSEESGFIKKWTAPGANISRSNKYIFGESIQQGTSLNLFSTPFYLGFKVDDLIFMSMNNYCFVASPESIVQEIQSLQIKNINFTNQVTNCKKNSITVCFGFDADCNITVYPDSDYTSGRIIKNSKTLEYTGNLLYAAIFSSPEIYECNIKRLGMKANELAKIYKEKIAIIQDKHCDTLIENNLNVIIGLAANLTSSKLKTLAAEASIMDSKNRAASCPIYRGEDY